MSESLNYPAEGQKITVQGDTLVVPDNPIVGFIKGDGIGPDVMHASLRIWDAAIAKVYGGTRKIYWHELFMGEAAMEKYDGNIFPDVTLTALKELVVSIKGPLTTPVGGGFRSLNVAMRQMLDLYTCLRPVRYYDGLPSPMRHPEKVDVVIFRENTEDVYAGIEYASGSEECNKVEAFLKNEMGANFFEGSGIGIKPISAFGSKRLIRKAIQYAIDNHRESVTIVHKGNIMKFTEGAFRIWGYEVAREEFGDYTITEEELYRDYGGKRPKDKIVIKDRIADNMFQLMLLMPGEFDVIATTNLNGDYLSDAVAAEVGGIGIAPGANMGDHVAIFEATHGTAPSLANQDKANPASLMFSGVMMLHYMGWHEAADIITHVYPKVLAQKTVTSDFSSQMEDSTEVGTSAFADILIQQIEKEQIDVELIRKLRQEKVERERQEREARRMEEPLAAMAETGRTPFMVDEIMSRNLITVHGDDTVDKAMKLMKDNNISTILVAPKDASETWGILTKKDIIHRVIHNNQSPATVQASEIAAHNLITMAENNSLHDCISIMTGKNIRRLIIVDKDEIPIGMVSDTDILRVVSEFGWLPE